MSEQQAAASRENGAKSQGPITEAGKARSSMNAMKSGLYSKKRFIDGESEAEFNALFEEFVASYDPQGPVESILVDRMVMARWRMFRVERAEAAEIEIDRNRFDYLADEKKWDHYGGFGLTFRAQRAPAEQLAKVAEERDRIIQNSLSIPKDYDRFLKVTHALNREFDQALRQLCDLQARRENRAALQAARRDRQRDGAVIEAQFDVQTT